MELYCMSRRSIEGWGKKEWRAGGLSDVATAAVGTVSILTF